MPKLYLEYVLSLMGSFHSSSYSVPKDRDFAVSSHIQINDWPGSPEGGITVCCSEGTWTRHCLLYCESMSTESAIQEEGGLSSLFSSSMHLASLIIERDYCGSRSSHLSVTLLPPFYFGFHVIEVKRTGFVTIVLSFFFASIQCFNFCN